MRYYIATVKVELTDGEKVKTVKEEYLVNAISVTDVEVKINELFKDGTLDFEVSSVRETKIKEVVE